MSGDNSLLRDDCIRGEIEDFHYIQWLATVMSHLPRSARWEHRRVNFGEHVEQLMHEGKFRNEYRMSLSAFEHLVDTLAPSLQRDEHRSRSAQAIQPEHIAALGLRALGGGRLSDIRHIIGCSRAAAYVAFDDFVNAVNACPEFDIINFPVTASEWKAVNDGFTAKSSDGIMQGCVGAIDGYFQRVQAPRQKEVGNVEAYYSGHYEDYGVNCQACVKSDLSFMYFGVVAPGSTNDNISYPMAVGMKNAIENLPPGLYCVADAAYTLGETLIIPFTGVDRNDKAQDAFNFYLSQLRIRVEMAFGRLTNKFRILKGSIVGSLDRVTAIVMACARLHNYIIMMDGSTDTSFNESGEEINQDDDRVFSIKPHPDAPLGMSYLPVIPGDDWEQYDGISYARLAIVEHLREQGIGHPQYNLDRKQDELVHSCNYSSRWSREYVSPI